jgi:hypothetical protein
LRQFAGLGVLFLAGYVAWVGLGKGQPALAVWPLASAACLAVVGGRWPQMLRPIFVGWMVLAFPVGWLVLNGCLTLLFYGVLTPVGLVFKAIGRDVLARRYEAHADSYWEAKPVAAADSYLRPF